MKYTAIWYRPVQSPLRQNHIQVLLGKPVGAIAISAVVLEVQDVLYTLSCFYEDDYTVTVRR